MSHACARATSSGLGLRRLGREPRRADGEGPRPPRDRERRIGRKVTYLRDELGLDAAFNYKAGPLRGAAPRGGARRHRRLLRQRRRGPPRGGDRSATARRPRRPVRSDLRVRRVASGAGPEQPLPRRRERPHAARVSWSSHVTGGRDDARDRRLAARGTHPLPTDGRRRLEHAPRPSPVSCAARRPARRGADRVAPSRRSAVTACSRRGEVAASIDRRAMASPPHGVARSPSLKRSGSSSIMFHVAPSRPNPTQKAAIVPSSTISSSLKWRRRSS